MEIVKILRQLWKLRLFVVLVALFALFVGSLVSYRISPPTTLESRKYSVGTASARILVDTPASQVVDVAPKGSDAVGARATLLANLMVDGEIKLAIAKRAGLEPGKLQATSDSADGSAPAERPNPRGYILSTKVLETTSGTSLPIIEVAAQGPDARAAETLANAAVDGLREYLNSKASAERVPDAQRLQISGLNRAQGRQVTRGPRNIFAFVAAVFIFVAGCAALLMISGLIRAFRAPEPEEGEEPVEPYYVEVDPRHGLRAVVDTRPTVPAQPPQPVRTAKAAGGRKAEKKLAKQEASVERPVKEAAGNWWDGGPA